MAYKSPLVGISGEGISFKKEDEVFNIRQFCYIFAPNAKIGCIKIISVWDFLVFSPKKKRKH